MTGKRFVDSNILIYAHDADAAERQRRAAEVLAELWDSGLGVLSTQVLQEFYVNVTRKIKGPLSPAVVREMVRDYAHWGSRRSHRRQLFRVRDLRGVAAFILGWNDSGGCGIERSRCVADGRSEPR